VRTYRRHFLLLRAPSLGLGGQIGEDALILDAAAKDPMGARRCRRRLLAWGLWGRGARAGADWGVGGRSAAAGRLDGFRVLSHEALAVVGLVIAVGLVGVKGIGKSWVLDRTVSRCDG
jgi:hypothetical protein